MIIACDVFAAAAAAAGWTATDGVTAAYGDSQRYLEPLRSLWQGCEGILWLCVAPWAELKGGEFYLDRSPQRKHMAGPFFSEGSFTKNTPAEVEAMMQQLQLWSAADTRPDSKKLMIESAKRLPLKATEQPIDLHRFMGDWHVLAVIPTAFETAVTNGIEKYKLDEVSSVMRGCLLVHL